jgi:hypothetical protein
MTGQNILVSRRVSFSGRAKIVTSNAETIVAKTQARIGTIAHLSIIALRVGPLKALRDARRF